MPNSGAERSTSAPETQTAVKPSFEPDVRRPRPSIGVRARTKREGLLVWCAPRMHVLDSTPMAARTLARHLTDVLNPFALFTALLFAVALAESPVSRALFYAAAELFAASAVAGYVLLMRRRARVGDFWISARAERLAPALFLLSAFVVLLGLPGCSALLKTSRS